MIRFSLRTWLGFVTAICLFFGLIRGVEYRTPYYEMDGGIWIELRHYEIHQIYCVGFRYRSPQFEDGKFSFQFTQMRDLKNGNFPLLCALTDRPGFYGGTEAFYYGGFQAEDRLWRQNIKFWQDVKERDRVANLKEKSQH